MVAISKILFFATSVCASVLPRDAATVQSDLNTINADVIDLRNTVNGYNGGLFTALPVQQKAETLAKAIEKGTTDANASAPVSESESAAIVAYITDTLEPNIDSTLKAVVAKKPQFTAAGVQGIVKSEIASLQTDTNDFGKALIAKAAPGSKASGQAVLDKINGEFDAARAAYN